MKAAFIKFIIILGTFLTTTVTRGANTDTAVFQNLSNCLDTVGASLPKDGDWGDLNELWVKMDAEISKLQNVAQDHSLTQSYKQSIENVAAALMRLAKDNKEHSNASWFAGNEAVSRTEQVCSGIERDLRVKVKYATQKPNDPFSTISVTVRTLQNQQEAKGCEVWYVGIGWADLSDMYQRFPSLSSPTKEVLAPGNYAMWTKKDDKLGDRETITIDDTTDTIELSAPE